MSNTPLPPQNKLSLNPAQKKAVEHGEGPLLIIAGAGTGKTRVITQRIQWLVEQKKAKASEILALTFTQKAAQEMEERVDEVMPYGYEPMWISTFHSFADLILKQEAIYIGLDPGYVLMSQAQEYVFFRNHLFEFSLNRLRPHGNPTKFIKEIISHFSRLGDEDVSPQDYLDFLSKDKTIPDEDRADHVELATVYKEYSDLKEKESKLGFYDLVPYVLKLFRSRQSVLKRYQEKFKYILVDEFQDTNYSQNELVALLAGENGNITVVGDDDQSIYKFRGAAISNIIDFKKRYPNAKNVVLAGNYRSNQQILDTAYTLIRNNDPDRLEVTEGVDKKLISMRDVTVEEGKGQTVGNETGQFPIIATDVEISKKGGKDQKNKESLALSPDAAVVRIHEHNELGESERIAEEIVKLTKEEKNYSYSDIAILVRANDHANEIVKSLRYHEIPFRYLGTKGLYTRPEVKDLIAMVSIIIDLQDDISMYRLLTLRKNVVTAREYVDLQRLARKKRLSMIELLETLTDVRVGIPKKSKSKGSHTGEVDNSIHGPIPEEAPRENLSYLKDRMLSSQGRAWVTLLLTAIDKALVQAEEGLPVGRILYDMAEKLDYFKPYTGEQTAENEWKAQNIAAYFKTLQKFERENDEPTVRSYIDYLRYSVEIGEDPQVEEDMSIEFDAINISTIHGAKGLEFPVVFLVSMVNERFPTRRRGEVLPIPDALVKERLPQGDFHIQEERRLCYVGMTRAMDRLYLTSADYYAQAIRKKKQSIFLQDTNLIVPDVKIDGSKDGKNNGEDLRRMVETEGEGVVKIEEPMRRSFLAKVEKNLSYSHLSSYENCPYQFYFKYFLEIPGTPSASRSFGLTIHNTLREFYERIRRSKASFEGFEKYPDLDDLLSIYREKWQGDGYENRMQENSRYTAGKKSLITYYKTLFSAQDDPLELEYHFRTYIGEVRLKGVVDRIDQVKGGVRILDYKTGSAPKDEKEVKNDLQVPIYIMGIEQAMGVKVVSAEYLFLEEGKRIAVPISDQMREKAVKNVADAVSELRKLNFSAKPGMLCKFCDYRNICDYAMMG